MQLLDDLDAAFGAGAYSILSVAAPDLTLNPGYDGSSDSNLLAGTDTLAAGASVTVSIDVRVAAPGAYLNRAPP